jgi:NADPH:quinone reductase-like Zn-dependent oxidoreductase
MKAFVLNKLNEFPVCEVRRFPVLKENEIYLKINGSALNHRDLWISQGMYPGIKLGTVLGSDGCGISGDVKYIINPGINWGTNENCQSNEFSVLGMPEDGTFAEYIAIDTKYLYPQPQHLSDEEAASLPLAGVTAFRALMKRAGLNKQDKVLVTGIGGGVAIFALQFAVASGCEVIVTSGSDFKIAEAIGLGAKAGYIYHDPEWSKKLIKDEGGVDVIIDGACGTGFAHLVKACHPGARIVFYGGTAGKIDGLIPQHVFWKQITIMGSTMGSAADFADMLAFVSHHKIKPVIDSVFPLDQLADGFRRMQSGQQFGKIVFSHQ